jgi:AcrR family transcriptional regulator
MPRAALRDDEIEAFREGLCRAATRLFAERGHAGVTLRALAAELGCSPMTPYRYFRDKDEIFAAVRVAAYERFEAAQEAAAAGERDPARRLRALGRAYVRFALDEPHAYRIMFELSPPQASESDSIRREAEAASRPLRRAVTAAVDAGVLAGDPETLAHLFWSGLHGPIALHLAGKLATRRSLPKLIEPMMDLLFRGAASSPTPAHARPLEETR